MTAAAVDLFAGIGGFSLAAAVNGIETVAQVEIDETCRNFLRAHWGPIQHGDIKTFDGRPYAGAYLLTGGPPCQPVSCAGKRRGAEDDRWLWPEALRILEEVRPAWCLFENPAGFRNMGLDGILSEMEGRGYASRVFDIPACGVGSPHQRRRYWIVGKSTCGGTDAERQQRQRNEPWRAMQGGLADNNSLGCDGRAGPISKTLRRGRPSNCAQGGMADAAGGRFGEHGRAPRPPRYPDLCRAPWDKYVWLPCADGKSRRAPSDSQRMANGLPVELLETLAEEEKARLREKDDYFLSPKRDLIGALGNSIVWQIAAKIIAAMKESEV